MWLFSWRSILFIYMSNNFFSQKETSEEDMDDMDDSPGSSGYKGDISRDSNEYTYDNLSPLGSPNSEQAKEHSRLECS